MIWDTSSSGTGRKLTPSDLNLGGDVKISDVIPHAVHLGYHPNFWMWPGSCIGLKYAGTSMLKMSKGGLSGTL